MKLNIGETIKKLRKERDITQEEFAEVLGVSCQSVSRWENNSCYPDIELIMCPLSSRQTKKQKNLQIK